MNEVNKKRNPLELDPDGKLFDPQLRALLARFVPNDETLCLETASALRSAALALDTLRARGAGSGGISAGAMDILLELGLGEKPSISLTEVSRLLGVSPRNITGLVDTLEKGGLVERFPDTSDRRSVQTRITQAGLTKIEQMRKPTQLAMRALFSGLDKDELAQFRDLLYRVINNAEKIATKI